ncbi:phosphatase PAP2 family protein [Nocardioides solisilvae]|uniref:phosphatase PAP2 family protein n=1 Tax=Nocardioides solisilvae TaxID=1542435 RepID=UPI0013A550D4|nr:phosphatase PAP2 family protein [Nocardioides solisilvae]
MQTGGQGGETRERPPGEVVLDPQAVALLEGDGPVTSRRARILALAVWTAALAGWIELVELPKSVYQAFTWTWLAVIAWNVQAPWRSHLAFLRDWLLPLAVLTFYLYSRGLADDLGLVGVHVTEPIEADRALFGGTLPTEWLQARLCGVPCERTAPRAWYDVVLTTVYYSHFFVAPVTAAVLWVRHRPAWVRFMRRYLGLNVLALVVYVLYPMSPPWLASRDGFLTDDIARITGRGWYDLGPGNFQDSFSAVGNPVAAMPSLHAGIAFFLSVYAFSRCRGLLLRAVLVAYPLVMAFALVYYAEHYVVDVLAGWLAAGAVLVAAAAWERRRPRVS